jgi:hypothetical protein
MSLRAIRQTLAAIGLVTALGSAALGAGRSAHLVLTNARPTKTRQQNDQFTCVQRAITNRVPAGTAVSVRVAGAGYDDFAILWRYRLRDLSWPRLPAVSGREAKMVLSVKRQPGGPCGGVALVVSAR